MRLFVGVELDDRTRQAAASAAEALRASLERTVPRLRARWVPADNLHVTLVFLGEVAEDRAAAVFSAMAAPFAGPPFEIGIGGLGVFPPSGPARVFWIGVRSGVERVAMLQQSVATRLQPHGFESEKRPYHAHLTIARIPEPARGRDGLEVRELLRQSSADAGQCRVGHATVFRSRLSPKGAAYEAVLRVPLG